MGNKQSLKAHPHSPKQFITQAHVDWMHQMQNLFLEKSTMTKTVILPPGVHLDDERINDGVVVAERKYSLPLGTYPEWPETIPFECDVDKVLLPPCQGQEHTETHYAVYPNEFFLEVSCAYCNTNVDLCSKTFQSKKSHLSSDKDASIHEQKESSDFLHSNGSVHSKTLSESNQCGSNHLELNKQTEIVSTS